MASIPIQNDEAEDQEETLRALVAALQSATDLATRIPNFTIELEKLTPVKDGHISGTDLLQYLCQKITDVDSRKIITKHFKDAVSQVELLKCCEKILKEKGFDPKDKVLFATSCCVDEINRDLDELAEKSFGRAFCLGGLAGYPFVGKTGFKAFFHHVGDNCCMFIIAASHVGVDKHGNVGRVQRNQMKIFSPACGALIGAYKAVEEMKKKEAERKEERKEQEEKEKEQEKERDECLYDQQQNFIIGQVKKIYNEVSSKPTQDECMKALSQEISKDILAYLERTLPVTLTEEEQQKNLSLFILSGVQINWEESLDSTDYFEPLTFNYYPKIIGTPSVSLMSLLKKELKELKAQSKRN